MPRRFRPFPGRPARSLGSTVLWGLIEFVALCRTRWLRGPRDG